MRTSSYNSNTIRESVWCCLMGEYIMKSNINILLYDHKHCIEDLIGKANSSFDLLMRYFGKFKGPTDLEAREPAKEVYKKLGWGNEDSFDVINSFWTTFSFAAHITFPQKYRIEEAGYVHIYKKSFPEKYVKGEQEVLDDVKMILKRFPKFEELAKLTHCAANFMPCPKFPYNKAKGCLKDVKDYFPLMIDKIKKSSSKGNTDREDMTFMDKGKPFTVYQSIVNSWYSEWFKKNREKYFLEEYYEISCDIIKGKPLFAGQSLESPLPLTEEQMNECLNNIISRIKNRAKKMAERLACCPVQN